MALFRIDQPTPGVGVPGRARHDLIPGETITLTATSPAPGPGVSFTWELLDKVNTSSVLSSTSGTAVTIASGGVLALSGWKVRLTANNNGTITTTERVFSVRSTTTGLRPALFAETSPASQTLGANTPDLSTDNAYYADLAGTGIAGQNWRGFGQWANELIQVIEGLSGGGYIPSGPASGDLGATYPAPTVVGLRGRAIANVAPISGQVLTWNTANNRWEPQAVGEASLLSSGKDDFIGQPGMDWQIYRGGNGTVGVLSGTAFIGYKGEGWLALGTQASSDDAQITSRGQMHMDSSEPMVVEWRCSLVDASFVPVTSHTVLFMGWLSAQGGRLGIDLTAGTATLMMYDGTLPATTTPITLPARSGTQTWRFRLTCTPTLLTLQGAIDDGAYSTLGTIAASMPDHEWVRTFVQSGAATPADRFLLLDYVSWSSARVADGSLAAVVGSGSAAWDMDQVALRALAQPKDNFTPGVDPATSDDDSQGYGVGSVWVNIANGDAFVCVDPTTSNAVWKRTTLGLTASAPADVTKAAAVVGSSSLAARSDHKHNISTAAAVALTDSTNAEGSATSLARSDHTHAHGDRGGGTLHAIVTDAANGFLDKDAFDAQIGKSKSWQTVFRHLAKSTFAPDLFGNASGAGSAAQAAVAATGYEGILRFVTGTTSTGFARVYTNGNWYYSAYIDYLVLDVVATIGVGGLPDGTDNYTVRIGVGLPSGAENGFGFTFDRAVSTTDWQISRWNAGVGTHTGSGVAADTGRHRFRIVYDRVAASAQYFIDGTSVGTVSTIPAQTAEYICPLEIRKTLGINSREAYIEYARCDIKYTTARPG